MTETEVKIRWDAPSAEAQALIESQGYRLHVPRTLEINQLFDRPLGELKQAGLVLRLRRAGERFTVTYKGPALRRPYKSREEIEFQVSDAEALEAVLDRLGYQPGFRYEKYRTEFSDPAGAGLITLDETPVGVFLELEGAEDWIDGAAKRLGFAKDDYILLSYSTLYANYREQHAAASRNMTFGLE